MDLRFGGWVEKAVAEADDLLTAEGGKLGDVGLTLRQTELHLKPAVRLPLCHQTAFPQPFEGGVGVDSLAAQRPVCQGAHGEVRVPVGGYIGVAGRIAGTDIVGRGGINCFFSEEYGGRTEQGLGAAVGTFDIDSFH